MEDQIREIQQQIKKERKSGKDADGDADDDDDEDDEYSSAEDIDEDEDEEDQRPTPSPGDNDSGVHEIRGTEEMDSTNLGGAKRAAAGDQPGRLRNT